MEDCHEAILSREEFMAAQKILREQEGRKQVSFTTYLFSGKIRCADCQYALQRIKSPTPRYYCITRRRAEDCRCMKGHLKESELAEAVFAAVRVYMEALLDRQDSGRIPVLRKQLAALQGSVKECQERKARLYEQLADEEISRETFKSSQAALSRRQEEAQEDQERLEEELAKLEHLVSSGQVEEQTLERYLGMEELTREMVEAFID